MKKDSLYSKLIVLSIIYEKCEECRQQFVEMLTLDKGEIEDIIKVIDNDPQFRQWVKSIRV